jgi:hypothetical protein
MSSLRVTTAIAVLILCIAGISQAAEAPTVNTPTEGALLGPSFDITGSVSSRALVIVLTDAVFADTGELISTVPGIRHYPNDDLTFSFHCASPRVSLGDRTREIAYRVRCFTMEAGGGAGPETVINCKPAG